MMVARAIEPDTLAASKRRGNNFKNKTQKDKAFDSLVCATFARQRLVKEA